MRHCLTSPSTRTSYRRASPTYCLPVTSALAVMSLLSGCESKFLAEVSRVGFPVLVVGILVLPTLFALPKRYRLRVVVLGAFIACFPGVLAAGLSVATTGSLCGVLDPRCLKAGPCWASNFMYMLTIGIPLSLVAAAIWLVELRGGHGEVG